MMQWMALPYCAAMMTHYAYATAFSLTVYAWTPGPYKGVNK